MSFSDVSEDQNELGSKAEEPEDLENTPGRKTVMSEAIKKFMSLTQSPYSDAEFLPETPSGAEVPSAKSARSSLGTPTSVPPKSTYISVEQEMKKELTKLENKMREREKYFQVELEKKDNELKARAAKQAKMEAELKARAAKQAEMEAELNVVAERENKQLGVMEEEYKKKISQLEEDKKVFEVQEDMLRKKIYTTMQHLTKLENALQLASEEILSISIILGNTDFSEQ